MFGTRHTSSDPYLQDASGGARIGAQPDRAAKSWEEDGLCGWAVGGDSRRIKFEVPGLIYVFGDARNRPHMTYPQDWDEQYGHTCTHGLMAAGGL